jgi:hypothetical protein
VLRLWETQVAFGTVSERVVSSLRQAGKRLSGRRAKKRSGYFYVWTRTVLAVLDRHSRRRPVAVGLESVTVDALPSRVAGASYRELEPPADDVRPPVNWAWPSSFASSARTYRTPAHAEGRGVVEIPGGVVFGFRGYFGPDPGGVLTEASSLWSCDERTLLAESAEALAVGLEELDGVTMSVSAAHGGNNYAHCLLQTVPRLDLLRRGFGLEADRFLLDARSARPTFEALDILGIPAERLHPVPRALGPAYRCATLRAATPPPFAAEWPTAFLHELFLPEPPTTTSRRVYIRREGPRRAVLNEDEVIGLLESVGFETLSMDGPTVREQAAVFAGADVIVSAHGASLANLVFARPGTAVIELMGRNSASVVYAHLAWRRRLRYEMVMGIEPGPPDRWWTFQILADTVVDVPALRHSLERLGVA